jgi:hypothetical protein
MPVHLDPNLNYRGLGTVEIVSIATPANTSSHTSLKPVFRRPDTGDRISMGFAALSVGPWLRTCKTVFATSNGWLSRMLKYLYKQSLSILCTASIVDGEASEK